MALSTLKHCPVCREFCTQQVSVLIKHIGLVHATKGTPFRIVCGLGGCQHRFSNYHTYRNHVYTIHSDSDDLSTPETAPVPISSLVGSDDSDGDDYQLDRVSARQTQKDPLQEAAARFILKTKETHRLTQTVMNSVIHDVTIFSQVMLGELHYATTKKLEEAGVDQQIISSLAPLFQESSKFGQPFEGLQTAYRQMKYFQQHFNFVVRVHMCMLYIHMYMYVPVFSVVPLMFIYMYVQITCIL